MEGQLPSEYYSQKISDRNTYEDRAKLIAKLTLPYVIREESDSGTTAMTDSNNQSYGGRLVNTLKGKMGMALLPPATSSFRYVPNPEELAALTGGSKENMAKTHQVLSQNVDTVNKEIELQQIRNSLFEVIVELIIVGSVIVEKVEGKGVILHKLQTFVVDLDSRGEPIKMCIKETLPQESLPEGITVKQVQDEYELYTMLDKDGETKAWKMRQEIEGELVGEEKSFNDYMDLPFRYLGWTWMVGDDYHRPYAEDYYKDLKQLDKLSKLLTDGSIVAAKVLLFVDERGGHTRKDEVAESANGDVVDGRAEDVSALKLEKNFDFQVPMEREANLKKELAASFLMNESATRDAERVTAEEIRFMAQELESSTLSGIYSKLSLQWSKWIVHQVMLELGIKFESIEVEILTGLDALGRSAEARKLDNVMARAEALGLRHWFHDDELINRILAFESVNSVGLIKTPKEVEAEIQKQQQAMAEQVGMESMAAKGGERIAEEAVPKPEEAQQ